MIEAKELCGPRRRGIAAVLAVAGAMCASAAHAEQLLLQTTTTLFGTQSAVYSLSTSGAGTVTATLTNHDWPERFASLSFALATTSGVLKTLSEEGRTTIDVSSAGNYYAIVSGTAQGRWNAGMFTLSLMFSPLSNGPGPVPLPGALWLMLSGLAGMWAVVRKRTAVPLAPAH